MPTAWRSHATRPADDADGRDRAGFARHRRVARAGASATRRGSPPWPRAGPPRRTRAARPWSPRWRPHRASASPTSPPRPGARPPRSPSGWDPPAPSSPSTSTPGAPDSCARPGSVSTCRGCRWGWPTACARRCGRRPSTACCSTPPARGSGCCAVGPTPAGGSPPRSSRSARRSNATSCSPPRRWCARAGCSCTPCAPSRPRRPSASTSSPPSACPRSARSAPPRRPWKVHGRGALLLPHERGTDGMFVLLLRAPGGSREGCAAN